AWRLLAVAVGGVTARHVAGVDAGAVGRTGAGPARVANVRAGALVGIVAAGTSVGGRGAGRGPIANPRGAHVAGAAHRGPEAGPARVAGVSEGASVGVVASLPGLGRHRAARGAIASAGVALVVGAGDGGPASAETAGAAG